MDAQLRWALAAFVIAWLWLWLRADATVQKDASRDLAFARDLVDGAQFYGHGTWSGFGGMLQGTSWVNFLALAELAGLGIAGIERVLTVVLAATVAGSCLGFARLLPASELEPDPFVERARAPVAVAVGGLVTLALLTFGVEVPLLWQPLLLPVPILLMHLCLWRLLRHGELIDALALAIFAALAFDVHLISVAVIWLALIAVPMASRRPLIATSGALILGLATSVLSSPKLLPDHYARLVDMGLLVPVALAPIVALGIGIAARQRFAKLDWPARLRLALGVELGVLVAVVLATALERTPEFGGRYVLVFLPAIGFAAALVASWSRSRIGLAAATLLALSLMPAAIPWLQRGERNELPSNPTWRAAAFDEVAARLDARGLTWTEAALRLQSPGLPTLLSHLAVRLEPGEPDPPAPETGLLLLAYEPAEARTILASLGEGGEGVEQIEIELGLGFDDATVLLIETSARTDRSAAEICRDHSEDCMPVVLTVTERVVQAHPSSWISPRDKITAGGWLTMNERPAPRELLWRLPISPGPAAVLGFPDALPSRCNWSIVTTEGFEPGVELPARTLELGAEVEGAILVSRSVEGEGCEDYGVWPPTVIETDPSWAELRSSLASDW